MSELSINKCKHCAEADDKLQESDRENRRLSELLESAVHHLDYESFLMWREDSPNWEAWYKKVERLKEHLPTRGNK